jgi:hypothetical protein
VSAKTGEIIVYGVILGMACFLFYVATTFPLFEHADKLGPAFWPKTVLLVVIVLSGTAVIQNTVRAVRNKRQRNQGIIQEERGHFKRLALAIFFSLVYGFSVPYTGFLLSILVFQVIFLLILKVKNIWILLLYPLALTTFIYLIFIEVLYIPLPRGQGIFLTFSRFFY